MARSSTCSRRSGGSLIGLLTVGLLVAGQYAQADSVFVKNREAGFVVSFIKFALAEDAAKNGACPAGMTVSLSDRFASTAAGKRRSGETEEAYLAREKQGVAALSTAVSGENLCTHPEAGQPDPYFRTVQRSDIPVYGFDLDGRVSTAGGPGTAGSCAHSDFPGINGEAGIDNQFYRVVGCSPSYQSTGASNEFNTTMLTGSWGILIHLKEVDDIHNDDHVEVGIYANADPVKLSPGRNPLAYATYTTDHDTRFRAQTRGQIRAGVLTTDPVDVRLHDDVNSMLLERFLRDAQLQLTLSENGEMEGYLGGYTPVEAMYDLKFGYRNGKTMTGELAPARLRSGSANGAAFVLGHSCNGTYYALYEHADGHPDPETGRCTSISNQYYIKAIPAFIIDGLGWLPPAPTSIAELQ